MVAVNVLVLRNGLRQEDSKPLSSVLQEGSRPLSDVLQQVSRPLLCSLEADNRLVRRRKTETPVHFEGSRLLLLRECLSLNSQESLNLLVEESGVLLELRKSSVALAIQNDLLLIRNPGDAEKREN